MAIGVLTSKLAGLDKKDGFTIAIESGVKIGTLGVAVGVLIAANVAGSVTLPPTTIPAAVYGRHNVCGIAAHSSLVKKVFEHSQSLIGNLSEEPRTH